MCQCHVSRGAVFAAHYISSKKIATLYKSVLRGSISIALFLFYRPAQRVCTRGRIKLKFQFQARVSAKVIAIGIVGRLALIIIAQTSDQA